MASVDPVEYLLRCEAHVGMSAEKARSEPGPAITLLAGTLAFLVCSSVPRAVLTLALVSQAPPRPDRKGDLFLAIYLLALASVLATFGFLLVTALDRRWRGLAWRRAALVAGGLGLASPIARFLSLAAAGGALLPIIRSYPALGTGLHYGLPGVLLGIVALLIARRRPKASTATRN
jgi:hypothetical protein